MSSREGGRGKGGAGLTARSLLSTPVNTKPPRDHVAEPLPRRTNTTTLPQNTTQHANNHSTNNHNTRPTHKHTKNTTFRVQIQKINSNITTEKQNIRKNIQRPLRTTTKISKNNSGYYAITDKAAAVDKLTSLNATELFKKLNLKPIKQPHIPRHSENCHSTNKPTNQHLRSHFQATHIKLAALVIEAHIASLAKSESYESILSKSLKRNFNIDTSFPDKDSQKIFNLFINPTLNPEPAPFATSKTNTGTIPTHHDLEAKESSTKTNDTQDENSDSTAPEQSWETRPKKKTTEYKESLFSSCQTSLL
ncbi:hypothetical protein FHG87_015050 [Trinorchestia longiramus]|nr:hypothetical protein FHG87_015050 [Trinorchestia longiramus]